VLVEEHRMYPQAILDIIEGRIWLEGDHVRRDAS
jgi:folate-dependent phosphoribosylglycinamide formyltransferase PurN